MTPVKLEESDDDEEQSGDEEAVGADSDDDEDDGDRTPVPKRAGKQLYVLLLAIGMVVLTRLDVQATGRYLKLARKLSARHTSPR